MKLTLTYSKRIIFAIQVLIVAVIFFFFIRKIYSSWVNLGNFSLEFDYVYLLLAALFAIFVYLFTVVGYAFILKRIGVRIPLGKITKARLLSDIVSYVPGKVWFLVGRMFFLRKENIKKSEVFLSTALEMFIVFVSGMIIALLSLLLGKIDYLSDYAFLFFMVILSCLVLMHPKIAVCLINWILKLVKKGPVELHIRYSDMFLLIGFYFVYWVVSGLLLFFVVGSVYPVQESMVFIAIGVYASSWIVASLSSISPAGLGIREGLTAFLLSFYMPLAVAIVVAVMVRLFIAGFGALFALLSLRL